MKASNQQIRTVFYALRYELNACYGIHLGSKSLRCLMNDSASPEIDAIRTQLDRAELSEDCKAKFAVSAWHALSKDDDDMSIRPENFDNFCEVVMPILCRFGLATQPEIISALAYSH